MPHAAVEESLCPQFGELWAAGSLAWGCAHKHSPGQWEAGHSHRTWVRPMATLFFSRSSAWNSSSTAWGEGTHHGTAQEAPTACHELLKWGAVTPLSPVRAHPALPSSPCTSAQAQVPVQGLSSPKAFSRMGSRDLQLQARFFPFYCHPWSGRALVHGQEVTQGTVPVPAPSNCTRCSPPATSPTAHPMEPRTGGRAELSPEPTSTELLEDSSRRLSQGEA